MSEPRTVTPTPVTVPSEGERLSGLLYLPDGPGPHPAVVLAGGWCYVKEVAQPLFAEVFAQSGIAALVIDYRYFGGSTGEPRRHIDPWKQIEDYRNAVSFLQARDEVDAGRIGAWGISYSGGHVLILGALDPRVRAVCSVVPVIDGYDNLRLAHGTVSFRALGTALETARQRLYDTGEHSYIDHQPVELGAVGTFPFPASRGVFASIKESEAPGYVGDATAQSTEMLLAYSVRPFLSRLVATPTLMCVAEGDDHTHWDLAAHAYEEIPGPRKKFHVVPRSTHLTLYQDTEVRRKTALVAADWFTEHL
ncbi:alpha/beta hydrolase [Spongiactinospora sp. TRM90649]|uniref:alpha/beta hydrolase n=1 Tax=Spongiactinospora sp. TRM90649 TaxID=3031114 RepID=UPI0023F6F050|nr:alpha/beta hydrolase [Spongiactinospora sp. TRM90649]MDF5758070.1 alpha/beta fold hydrolase [Spongiactinospora sp. TRM90649]